MLYKIKSRKCYIKKVVTKPLFQKVQNKKLSINQSYKQKYLFKCYRRNNRVNQIKLIKNSNKLIFVLNTDSKLELQ